MRAGGRAGGRVRVSSRNSDVAKIGSCQRVHQATHSVDKPHHAPPCDAPPQTHTTACHIIVTSPSLRPRRVSQTLALGVTFPGPCPNSASAHHSFYPLRVRRAAASTLLELVQTSKRNQQRLFDATSAAAAARQPRHQQHQQDGEESGDDGSDNPAAGSADRTFLELLPAAADYSTQVSCMGVGRRRLFPAGCVSLVRMYCCMLGQCCWLATVRLRTGQGDSRASKHALSGNEQS
mgnify:CR=1 FL=1